MTRMREDQYNRFEEPKGSGHESPQKEGYMRVLVRPRFRVETGFPHKALSFTG